MSGVDDVRQTLADLQKQLVHLGHTNKASITKRVETISQELQSARDTLDDISVRMEAMANTKGFTFRFFSFAYLSRLFFSFLFLYISSGINSLSSVVAGYRTPNVQIIGLDGEITGKKTLPDILHDM